MVAAEKGVSWNNTAQPSVLFAQHSPLWVSMATHSLGNPPSSSRWGDDAVVCLCQVCSSPSLWISPRSLCVSKRRSEACERLSSCTSSNKTPPSDCGESRFTHLWKGSIFIANEAHALKLSCCGYFEKQPAYQGMQQNHFNMPETTSKLQQSRLLLEHSSSTRNVRDTF